MKDVEKKSDDKKTDGEKAVKAVVVSKLTPNVREAHVKEIFENYGSIQSVDLPMTGKLRTHRGVAYVEYESRKSAEEAIEHMNGAQIDGAIVVVAFHDRTARTGNITAIVERSNASKSTLRTDVRSSAYDKGGRFGGREKEREREREREKEKERERFRDRDRERERDRRDQELRDREKARERARDRDRPRDRDVDRRGNARGGGAAYDQYRPSSGRSYNSSAAPARRGSRRSPSRSRSRSRSPAANRRRRSYSRSRSVSSRSSVSRRSYSRSRSRSSYSSSSRSSSVSSRSSRSVSSAGGKQGEEKSAAGGKEEKVEKMDTKA